MKPYPNYKGNNLTDIIPRKIALVTEGANKKRFSLFKLNTQEGSPMKKDTALALIKGGNLSEDEMKVVLGEVAETDKLEVQKAIDALKSPPKEIDVTKLAEGVASEIVKAIEPKLSAIATSLAKTTETLENMVKSKDVTEDDKDLSDEEMKALITSEMAGE